MQQPANNEITEKLQKVRMVIFDVDGVLTDGKLYLSDNPEETKVFYAKDGVRTEIALWSGLKIIWLTGRKCVAVERRARELKVDLLYKQDIKEQGRPLFEVLKERFQVTREEILYMGDDWTDLHLMREAGIAATPFDGSKENRNIAHIVTESKGGEGAVTEVIEIVMKAQGNFDKYLQKYLEEFTP